jgi:KaiC/GvpD/RAD55 family RecA-like ATPase
VCAARIGVPFLDSLSPGGFGRGRILLMEFQPHSLWYEASYTIASQAIRAGIRTDYHVFQHVPEDALGALSRLGTRVDRARREGLLRLLDSYTIQSGLRRPSRQEPYGFASLSLRLSEWKKGALGVLRDSEEKDILHIDDNDSLLATANSEEEILDFFQSRAFAAARAKGITFLHGLATGIHSERFYHRIEAFVDGIVDFEAWDRGGQVDQVVRVRVLRGTSSDSRWRQLSVSRTGEVRIRGVTRPGGLASPPAGTTGPTTFGGSQPLRVELRSRTAALVFDFLAEAFLQECGRGTLPGDEAGWRSLVQIARGIGRSTSSLYPKGGRASPAIQELEASGLIYTRLTSGSRGRGGVTAKLRIAYENDPVRVLLRESKRVP